MVTSSIKLSPAAYVEHASLKHSRRKKATIKAVGTQNAFSSGSMFTDRILGQTKKPSELDGVKSELDDKFKGQQESDKKSTPQYKFYPVLTLILIKYKQKKRLQKHLTRYNFPIG